MADEENKMSPWVEQSLRLYLRSQGKEFPETPSTPEQIKRLQDGLKKLQEEAKQREKSET